MNQLRWGLIGCGDISRKRVVPAINAIEQCSLQAVTRSDAGKVESFAREFDVPRWYAHWNELLDDKDVDTVYIATPVAFHKEQTIAAARAGKHVLCEKPMALTAADCEPMIETCRNSNVFLGVAYYRHFYPVVKRIQEILESGEIGEAVLADIQAFEWFDRKRGEPRSWLLNKKLAGGGPVMDFGCHRIEVLQNLFGEVKEIESRIFNLRFTEREVEDTGCISMIFESSVHALLRVSHAVSQSRDSLDIFGTKGSISVPVLNKGRLLVTTEEGIREENLPPHENVHLPLIEDFSRGVLNKNEPVVNGIIGKKVNSILDEVYGFNGNH